jgi:hypothetical protein
MPRDWVVGEFVTCVLDSNSGIAMIVPVDQLKDLLNLDELVPQREVAITLMLRGIKSPYEIPK